MHILIRNGRVLDPANRLDGLLDVRVVDGKIIAVSAGLDTDGADKVIDADGLWVAPGLIDLHVHLRDPGLTHKEDIAHGARGAAAGGFTTICCMPNTQPVIDNADTARYVLETPAAVHVLPVGSMTRGQAGEQLSDILGMAAAGICALSEDGKTVNDTRLALLAMAEAAACGLPILSHCEDVSLVNGGVVNAGAASERLGLPGISNISEDIIIARDMLLAREAGARLHLCHMSTAGSVRLLRAARANGFTVTGEAAPHHFCLSDEDISDGMDANYKMNPPLRSRHDKEAVLAGLASGVITVIATDHAPHTEADKAGGFMQAANGIVGLETALGLSLTALVHTGLLTPLACIEKLTVNPARVLGIPKGTLSVGACADIVLIDPGADYTVDKNTFYSKGRNTPFHGRRLKGRAVYTIVKGHIVMEKGEMTDGTGH